MFCEVATARATHNLIRQHALAGLLRQFFSRFQEHRPQTPLYCPVTPRLPH